jgi:hypothetical protein
MKAAQPSPDNNGGIVVALVVLAAWLGVGMVCALGLYTSRSVTLARLISGWSNCANAAVHALLIVLLSSDTERFLNAGVTDADNVGGPLGLLLVNGLVGARTLRGAGPNLAFAWNTFVAITGSLVPMVWLSFLDKARLPYFEPDGCSSTPNAPPTSLPSLLLTSRDRAADCRAWQHGRIR